MPPAKRSNPGRALVLVLIVLAALFGGMAAAKTYAPALGLDLRGGTTVTLKAEPLAGKKITQDNLKTAVNIMRERVNGMGVGNADVRTEGNNIVVSVPGKDTRGVLDQIGETALLSMRQVYKSNDPAMTGAVVPDTSPTTPSATPSPGTAPSTAPSAPASSPSPAAAGSPSASASPKALSGGTSGFHAQPASFVKAAASAGPASGSPSSAPSSEPSPATGGTADKAETTPSQKQLDDYASLNCLDPKNQQGGREDNPLTFLVTCGNTNGTWYKYMLNPTLIQGNEIASASAVLDQTGTQWVINIKMKDKAAARWASFTTNNVGKDTAIVLDGLVMSAEYIREPIPGGNTQISGNFTHKSATDLANVLKYGALPLKFTPQTAETISATLGNTELRAGLLAGVIGLILVLLYSFAYYRGLSIVTLTSLALSAAIQYPIIVLLGKGIGYTLTLAGIAGLIVAVGVTADSFIVYFERLRDEIREGNTLRSAVEKGWVRARRTIVSADLVSLIAAVVLYWLAIGDVRGFAFTLGLSTIVDLFIVFAFTKPLITLLARTKFYGEGHKLSGLDAAHLGVDKLKVAAAASRRPASARRV